MLTLELTFRGFSDKLNLLGGLVPPFFFIENLPTASTAYREVFQSGHLIHTGFV